MAEALRFQRRGGWGSIPVRELDPVLQLERVLICKGRSKNPCATAQTQRSQVEVIFLQGENNLS